MIDSRWERIEQLFFEAAELHGRDRERFLDRACGADAGLRREVETLLETDATAADHLTTLIGGTIQEAAERLAPATPLADAMEGVRLGPWLIVREIGRGGMGTVYLAERADAEFRKQVAIKLVKRGVDTDAVLRRFLHERQILAGLDHPNIAGLLDAGTSGDGRPYFVMEFVEGVPIQAFCEERRLTTRQRCELFRKVCEPVSYAHRNLVIHRDIKPANILVTADGSPRLLDFGIAKLLSQDPGDNTIGIDAAARPFTPAYASPEQVRGEAVNTATDVYSLGAVLSKILGEAGLKDRDLGNIVQKATHSETARRYASVDQLREDLDRYLSGRPVLARGDDWAYTASKFIRRHRVSVVASVVFALVVIGGVVTVLWEARQAQIQRQRAEERLGELVEVANATMLKVHGSIERLPGATEARREMVRTTVTYLDRLNQEAGNDRRILSAMASAYIRLARINGDPEQPNLGDYKGAEQDYQKAAKILDDLIAQDRNDVALRLERADCAAGYSQLLDASARTAEVNQQTERGLEAIRPVLAREPGNLAARKLTSRLHLIRVQANTSQDAVRAKAEIMEQLPLNQQLAEQYPQDPDCILDLAWTYSEVGALSSREGRTRESLAAYQKGVALRERLFAIQPNDVVVERDLMMSYGHIGDILGSPFLMNLGDPRGAIENYRKAEKIAESMVAADASNRQARVDLGIVVGRVGEVMQAPADAKESLAALERSIEILTKLHAATPDDISTATQLTVVLEYAGRRRTTLKEYPGALRNYEASSGICDSVLRGHPGHQPCLRQLVINDGELASLYAMVGDRDRALSLAARALERATAVAATGTAAATTYVPRSLGWAGDVYTALAAEAQASATQRAADRAQAARYYRQSIEKWKTMTPEMRTSYASEERHVRELAEHGSKGNN
jgi:tetratricopeptide (TPR) repeat protein